LNYVRIEFSGRKLNALKELNGLSLAGVGSKTDLSFIQISYSNDDSFESYGGNVVFNNLISYKATDDDFDFTQGVQCKINNSIAIRYPYFSDSSRSRCFEIDSYDKPENTDFSKKMTNIIVTNCTLVNNETNNQGLVKEAIYIKDSSKFEMKNSVVFGFQPAILLGNDITKQSNLDYLKVKNNNIQCEGFIKNEKNAATSIYDYQNEENDVNSNAVQFYQTDCKQKPDFRLVENLVLTMQK
jgi:hypothetical protein